MSRIFPDSNYNIYDSASNPRSKREWGYGFEKTDNPEFINYKEFIDKLDQHLDSDYKIWLGTDPYNPLFFSEICIFDQKNGNFHLIEYFPFKYQEEVNFIFKTDAFKRGILIKNRVYKGKKSPKSFSSEDYISYLNKMLDVKEIDKNKNNQGQLSNIDENKKKDILEQIKAFKNILDDYKIIRDQPVNRLSKFSDGIIDSLNITNKADRELFLQNNIHKHFFFGNLKSNQKTDYFITSEKEKALFPNHTGYDYGKGVNYYSRDEFDLLIKNVNKVNKNSLWRAGKHVKKVEFNFLPVIKAVEAHKAKKLSETQLKHVNRKAFSSRMRIKGIVGSGKTFCLTTRAMNYANEGKKVLFTYFTSSFNSYIINTLENPHISYPRRIGEYNEPSIVVNNVHMIFSNIIDKYYEYISANNLTDDAGYNYRNIKVIVPENPKNISWKVSFTVKIGRLIKHHEDIFFKAIGDSFYFDAIVIDEGQNFKSSWFSTLQKICLRKRPASQSYGDMMVAFDEKQKLFGDNEVGQSIKELSKPELINDPLNATYRIPPNLFEKVNLVRKKLGLSEIEYSIPTKNELDYMSEGDYGWINIPKKVISIENKAQFIVDKTVEIIDKNNLKLGDSAIITDDHVMMAKIQEKLLKSKKLFLSKDDHLESITDDGEILDKNMNRTTMILTECPNNYFEKLHTLLLSSNILDGEVTSWLERETELKMKSYGAWNPETKSRNLQNSYKLLNTDKYNLLFHLFETNEDIELSNKEDVDLGIPIYAMDPKLSKEALDLMPDVKYKKAYDWSKKQIKTHAISRRANYFNRQLKGSYDFSDQQGLVTHTIKSFQGQELPHIFIYLSNQFNEDRVKEGDGVKYAAWRYSWKYESYVNQLYVALTRSRKSAWLFNDSEELDHISNEFNR